MLKIYPIIVPIRFLWQYVRKLAGITKFCQCQSVSLHSFPVNLLEILLSFTNYECFASNSFAKSWDDFGGDKSIALTSGFFITLKKSFTEVQIYRFTGFYIEFYIFHYFIGGFIANPSPPKLIQHSGCIVVGLFSGSSVVVSSKTEVVSFAAKPNFTFSGMNCKNFQ